MNASNAVKTISRQELYELVWKSPMSRIAKEFGVSGAGLAKICDSYGIPRPPVGYWVKKANGKVVRRYSLPPCYDPDYATITIDRTVQSRRDDAKDNPRPLASTFFDSEIGELAEHEAKEHEPIKVSDSLRSPHLLVKRTQQGLIASTKDRTCDHDPVFWARSVGGQNCLDVHVGKEQFNRALRIMDALIKGLELRGYLISVPAKDWHRGMIVQGLGNTFQIRLREPTLRQDHVPNADERKRLKEYPDTLMVDKYDYVPSGKLQLDLLYGDGHYAIKTFRDGKKRTLEDAIADVPLAILRTIDHYRHRAVINAEEARKRAEIERQRREEEERKRLEEQRRKEEQQRMEDLFVEAETWARCQTLRAYLNAVRCEANERHVFIEKGSELDQKLEWAECVAEKFDPVAPLRQRAVADRSVDTSAESVAPRRPR